MKGLPPIPILAAHDGGTWHVTEPGQAPRPMVFSVRGALIQVRDFGTVIFRPTVAEAWERCDFEPCQAGGKAAAEWTPILVRACFRLGHLDCRYRHRRKNAADVMKLFRIDFADPDKIERYYRRGWNMYLGQGRRAQKYRQGQQIPKPVRPGTKYVWQRLLWARIQCDMTRPQAAELARIKPWTLRRYEAPKTHVIPIRTIERLARVYKCSASWLAFGEGEDPVLKRRAS
jgi:hypothetical protein